MLEEDDFFKQFTPGVVQSKVDLSKIKMITFYCNSDSNLETAQGTIKKILAKKLSDETNTALIDIVKSGQLSAEDKITVTSTYDINYSLDGIMTFRALFTSLFVIEKDSDKRYFILNQEYTKDAFYDFIKASPKLQHIGAQFLAIDEKKQLSENLKLSPDTLANIGRANGSDLKI